MTAQWVKFDGSDEQIAEMVGAKNGFVLRFNGGEDSTIQTIGMWGTMITSRNPAFSSHLTHYLICEPQPYADMICQWARTGQPVWYRALDCKSFTGQCLNDEFNLYPFARPDKYKYSFTPLEEEV